MTTYASCPETALTDAPRAPSHPRAAPPGQWVLAAGLPIVAGAVFYAMFIARSAFQYAGRPVFSLFDDAMISMRYAENLAHGHGLVWNPGAPSVEGYSNFLWTLYMALVHLLPIRDTMTSLVVMITGALLLCGTSVVVALIARTLRPDSITITCLAVTGTAFFYPLVYWTLRGMETGLATFTLAVAVLIALKVDQGFSRRRVIGLALVGGVALLVRDDLLVPVVVVCAYVVICAPRRQRLAAAAILVAFEAAVIGGHEAFRIVYYHSALPNPYYVKIAGTPLGTRLTRGVLALAGTFVLTLFAPVAAALAGVGRPWRRLEPPLVLLAAVVVSVCAYAVYVGGDAWEEFRIADRYLTTAAPLLFVLGAVGVHRLADIGRSHSWLRATSLGCGVLAAALAFLPPATMLEWLGLAWPGGLSAAGHRVALPLVGVGVLVVLAFLRIRRAARLTGWAAGLCLLLVLPNVQAYNNWLRSNGQDIPGENLQAELGLGLRRVTAPTDSIAAAAVGGIMYFSQRPGVDLLGLNDPHVAREAPKALWFHPGHTKWDYPYSIGVERPSIVYQLYQDPGGVGRRTLGRLGYVPVVFTATRSPASQPFPGRLAMFASPSFAKRLGGRPLAARGSPGGEAPRFRLHLLAPTDG